MLSISQPSNNLIKSNFTKIRPSKTILYFTGKHFLVYGVLDVIHIRRIWMLLKFQLAWGRLVSEGQNIAPKWMFLPKVPDSYANCNHINPWRKNTDNNKLSDNQVTQISVSQQTRTLMTHYLSVGLWILSIFELWKLSHCHPYSKIVRNSFQMGSYPRT